MLVKYGLLVDTITRGKMNNSGLLKKKFWYFLGARATFSTTPSLTIRRDCGQTHA